MGARNLKVLRFDPSRIGTLIFPDQHLSLFKHQAQNFSFSLFYLFIFLYPVQINDYLTYSHVLIASWNKLTSFTSPGCSRSPWPWSRVCSYPTTHRTPVSRDHRGGIAGFPRYSGHERRRSLQCRFQRGDRMRRTWNQARVKYWYDDFANEVYNLTEVLPYFSLTLSQSQICIHICM